MTELIWDGKSKDGKKQGPVKIALPFQTIETVNESAQDRQRSLELFSAGREGEWRNKLIWGDKKYILPSLLPEFAGKTNLIYIDPPFDTGANFSYTATIPDHPDMVEDETTAFVKEPSILEQKAYRDTWGRGLDSYLQWFYETVLLLRELLADHGSLYVHLDWHLGHYAKVVLDEVFGQDNLRNEVIWHYKFRMMDSDRIFNRKHDTILWYAMSEATTLDMDPVKEPWTREEIIATRKQAIYPDDSGREWVWMPGGKGHSKNKKKYLDEIIAEGKALDDVWDIPTITSSAKERVAYPTQKPEALLERIIKASSKEGDLVLDCFCGSGTTAAVAERLKRRWIVGDLSRFAIHTTRKRLLGIPDIRPFVVENLGRYERQAWQVAEFPANGKDHLEEQRQREAAYQRFILDLYHAEPLTGHPWLHGTKGGRMVHVGAVDAPVTLADVKAIAKEAWKAVGTGKGAPTEAGVDILGWEFAFELNELAKQVAAQSRVSVSFKKIPREVLDKKAVEQGDVRFFELGALAVDTKQDGHRVNLKLRDFVIPTDDIPEEARKAVQHWSQLIDYWAVDWEYKDDTFHNQWQTYRSRGNPKVELETSYKYGEPGKYTIVVKVIDILGNDTTKTLQVTVNSK